MTFYVEKETDLTLCEDEKGLLEEVAKAVCEYENCPYDISVNLVITDDEGIHACNKEFRQIDAPTDVLSFPGVDFEKPSDFSAVKAEPLSYLDPETKELMLGDIMISAQRCIKQAEEYGHSVKREYAFLLTHSFLHLFGYDHMTEEEEKEMFGRQEEILTKIGILRDNI